MKQLTDSELLKVVIKENGSLLSQLAQSRSDLDYISMMANIDLDSGGENIE